MLRGFVSLSVASATLLQLVLFFAVAPTASAATTPTTVDCPLKPITATNAPIGASTAPVLPAVGPTKLNLPTSRTGYSGPLVQALNNSVKYNVNTWWKACYGKQTGPIQLGGISELNVRGPAMAAVGIAASLKTGTYDPALTGVSVADATKIAKNLALGVVAHHKINDPNGWGYDWQTPYWSQQAGMAAWLLWGDLTPAEQQATARMVAAESDFLLKKPVSQRVPYYADRTGKIISPGDTKAEENAWNANNLELANMMLPADVRALKWNRLNVELLMSAFSRRADLNNPNVINGQPVSTWLKGYNVFDNGTLVNHNIIHPDYMAALNQNLWNHVSNGLAGQATPTAANFGLDKVYTAFTAVKFATPTYAAPGGTIYTPGSWQIYFPQGTDWGTYRMANYAGVDVLADSAGFDRTQSASGYATLHLNRVLAEQARFTDGRSYSGRYYDRPVLEDKYPAREQWVISNLSQAWLVDYLAQNGLVTYSNATVILPGSAY